LYCGGGHLGFPIDIKNTNLVEDLPMIIPGQFGFNCPSGFREEAFYVSKRFFSETTWTVETKLPRNDHWKVLYKVSVFYDRKSKMAATTGHSINTGENTEIYSSFHYKIVNTNILTMR
jgi:hypothetical protein